MFFGLAGQKKIHRQINSIGGGFELVRGLRNQGRNEGGEGGTIPHAPNPYRGAKSLRGAPKTPNNVTITFFKTVHLLPKDIRFEHGGAM